MTSDQHDDQLDRGADEGPWDPLVADRFRLLDRATPPAELPDLVVGAAAATPTPVRERARAPWVLAVAAAIATVVALSIGTLGQREDGADVAATGDGAGETAAEDPTTGDDGPGPNDATDSRLVVEIGPSSTTDGAALAGRPDAVTTDISEAPSSTAGSSSTSGNGPTTTSGGVVTTTSATPPTGSSPSTTTSPSTSFPVSLVPEKDPMLTFQGTVTEVFTDCQSHLGLDDQGKVVDLGPASCDGGSWIEIDGTRIRTSSGFVSSDQAYDRHPAGLRPGQQATVVAYKTASGLTLECVLCKVSIRN